MEQKTSYTNNSVLEIELSNESELQPNQFDKPPEYDCFSYSLQRKHIYFFAIRSNAFAKKQQWYYC